MRLVAVQNPTTIESRRLIDQMHALRARVFEKRLGWDVAVVDGREIDEYDLLNPTYLLVVNSGGDQVIGCARLLPGTGTTMLGRTFPALLDGNPVPHGRGVIESSRFCVDTEAVVAGTARGLHCATMLLFSGLLDWAVAHNYSQVMTVTDLRFERILGRAGLPFTRLGSPRPIGNTIAVAGIVPATDVTASSVRPSRAPMPGPVTIAA